MAEGLVRKGTEFGNWVKPPHLEATSSLARVPFCFPSRRAALIELLNACLHRYDIPCPCGTRWLLFIRTRYHGDAASFNFRNITRPYVVEGRKAVPQSQDSLAVHNFREFEPQRDRMTGTNPLKRTCWITLSGLPFAGLSGPNCSVTVRFTALFVTTPLTE